MSEIIKMKAAYKGYKEPWTVEEVDMDISEIPPYDCVIRVMSCGICGSDLGAAADAFPYDGHNLAGHEISGIVYRVGETVTRIKEGDHVIATLAREGCGHCRECVEGNRYACTNSTNVGKAMPPNRNISPIYTSKGEALYFSCTNFSGWAEYTFASEENLVVIPDDIPFEIAAIVGCGVITGFFGVINRAEIKPFDSVAVIGCGGVGLSALQGAKFCGAFPIIAIDVFDEKLEYAKSIGADYVINAKTTPDVVAEVRRITEGYGVDCAIVASPGAALKRQGFNMLPANHGTLFCLGYGRDEGLDFNGFELTRGRVIRGASMGSTRISTQIPKLLQLYKAGKIDLDSMVSNRFPLEKVEEAIYSSIHSPVQRNVFVMDEKLL